MDDESTAYYGQLESFGLRQIELKMVAAMTAKPQHTTNFKADQSQYEMAFVTYEMHFIESSHVKKFLSSHRSLIELCTDGNTRPSESNNSHGNGSFECIQSSPSNCD
jgi:hypothetical protein